MAQIQPISHEAKGHLNYHPRSIQRYDGLDPYWTIGKLLIQEFDGFEEIQTTIDGEDMTISLAYSKSGFAPRPDDNVKERLYEYELHVEGFGERKCHFNLSPRYPDMRHYETGDEISVPFDHLDAEEGVTVQFQSANLAVDEIPKWLSRALDELFAAANSSIDSRYFDGPGGGRIEELERYVRTVRSFNKKLIQKGGMFDRLAMLLSDESGTKGKHTWDNTEEQGYHHQLRIGPTGAGKLIPGHSRGRQIKSYLPENPEYFDEDSPLHHPKVGVLFRKSLNRSRTVSWDDRHELIESLDETIVNLLHWADIPVDVGSSSDGEGGGNTVFVGDSHFSVVGRDDDLPLIEDPTPRLEAEQDHLLMTILRDMTPSDSQIVEEVATDGGMHVDDLAESSGYSLSTIYRALKRLDGVIESREGHVRFVSQKIAEEIRGIVQSAEYAIESAADRAAHLFDIDVNQSTSSAFNEWLATYAAEFDAPEEEDGRPTIRIGTMMSELKSTAAPYLPDVLDELLEAWVSDGRRRYNIHDTLIEAKIDGTRTTTPLSTLRGA